MPYLRDIVHAAFIDTVVGEMHTAVVQLFTRSLVPHSGKAGKPLLIKVDPQRVVGCNGNVETKVKFEAWGASERNHT